MAKPKANQLEQASGLSPLARDWIKALVNEAADRVISQIPKHVPKPAPQAPTTDQVLKGRVDDLVARLEYLEKRYDDSETYSLTRAKVIALLKKEGL